jgi:antagonist of KipI
MSGGLRILAPGLLTTVQDSGRWGLQSIGVSVSGPMDPFAHRLANALVGNARAAATLEVTLTGPSVRFDERRVVAVTGALFDLFVDEVPVPHGRPVAVGAGAVLRFGARHRGARAYLAVSGGFDAPLVLGSRSTHLPTATGGWQGRALRRDDYLPLGPARPPARRADSHTAPAPDEASPVVRVMAGPDIERFEPDALEALVSAPYHVGVDSDRMGFRLEGPVLRHRTKADILSEATPFGTLQVPGSGQPVLLMADRQTTGGYARLATVISADLGVAGQAAPGDVLRFVICDRAEALRALVRRERPLLALEGELA